ncbi:hypothetical protein GLYMA_03G032800v4 [Glycine max]|uniref:Glycosyltransferase n=1 Tax=Glycine max TaxID=3847 RepID=I1JKV2_SOYBN|nr:UDP-glycosyltransferase 72D1 [Glycine max]KAG5053878.1 hypothetical protein JHK85_006388 [Glycine max]KRH65399.1 hypothetical protein GLYMA_03G032800v4 [Glycine max]|eukprot:XP_003522032.1 UDP-glycosyltransferase 72D1 [Glycine max]
MAISNNNHHALVLVSPGMGHIIPALELAKRLVTHKIISKLTFFYGSIKTSTPSKAETQILQSAIKENLFDLIQLPPIDLTIHVSPHDTLETKLAIIMHEIPLLFMSTISTMNLNPTMIITDFFFSQVIPLAKNLNLPIFAFAPTNSWLVALGLHTPTLDKEIEGEYSNESKPIPIPGCKSVHPLDLIPMMHDRTQRIYHEFVGACEGAALADGIFVNTFHELEPKTLEALGSGHIIAKVPVYPVGPIVRDQRGPNGSNEGKISDVFEWLDKQEEESVVYVSLGSGYTMSFVEMKEMALGLELSGNKFVWSVRPPVTKAGTGNYLTAGAPLGETGTTLGSNNQPSNSFPDEFYRIQTNGIVITDWAPQLDILKHPSIGGFVSHCGWNSLIESVSCGVPIIGLPLFAEQMMNATMLMEEVGNAIRVEVSPSTNMVGREELSKAIRKIMDKDDKEGCVMRERAKELKHLAERAWSHDGPSYLALSKITHSNGM